MNLEIADTIGVDLIALGLITIAVIALVKYFKSGKGAGFKVYLNSLKAWGWAHRKTLLITLGLVALGAVVIYAFHVLPPWKVWLAIWATSVIAPLVLGMLGKVGFRWAVLWECVMFFPIVLILALFVQDIRGYIAKGIAK